MFSLHQGDEVLATEVQHLPTYAWQPPARKVNGVEQPLPATREVKSLFYSATRETGSGKLIVKIVNRADAPQALKIETNGVNAIAEKGTATVLKADNRDATNSPVDPKNVVPTMETVDGLGTTFPRAFPPCSITILELQSK